jgi:hypothetical protein
VPGAGAGTLKNNGVTLNAGDSVSAADIAAGHLVFTPVLDGNGSPLATFTFQVQDNGGTANSGVDLDQSANTFTINATAVNDAPVNSVPTIQSVNEEATLTFSTGTGNAITISDVDVLSGNETVTLTVTSGILALGSTAGLTSFTNNAASITLTGTVANVNAALNGLTYTGNLNFNGADSLSVSTSDNGNTGSGGTKNDSDNVAINVVAVNDAPAGTDKTVTMLEGDSYIFSVADFGFSDPSDSPAANSLLAVKMTTVPGAGTGTFTNNGVTVNAGDSVSAANIAAGLLVFTPTAHSTGAPEATFTFQVQDNGGTANGGVDLDPSADSVSINVNAVNDAPINSVPLAAQNLNEEGSLVFSSGNGNAITIADIDVGSGNETVTLTVTGGTLALGSTAGLTSFTNNAASITLTGTVANVNAAMNGLTYTGNLNFNGTDTLVVSTNDNGNTGAGGPKIDSDNVTINVAPVNDAPTATNLNQSLIINEDAAPTTLFTAAPIVSDVDSTNVTAKLTLSAAAGVLNNAGAGVLSAGTLTYTITGTKADVNTALAAVTYDSAPDFNGPTSVGVTIDDGASGPQGTNPTGTVNINVNVVNDAPSFTKGADEVVLEDSGAHTVNNFATAISRGPADEAGQTVNFLVSNDNNALFSAGPAIDASGNLTYTLAANANGSAIVSVQIHDNGGTANGGSDTSVAQQFTITAGPVNDAPAGTNNTFTLLEDGTRSFTAADFGFTDPVDVANTSGANAFQAVIITTIPGAGTGTLTLDTGGGPVAVVAGQTIPVGQIGGLAFTPAANANGTPEASFTFQVKDDGGTANAGVDTDQSANTIAFDVTSVNDAPAGTDTTIGSVGAHTFSAAEFGFTDPVDAASAGGANALQAVIITTIPGAGTGTLTLDTGSGPVAVTPGQSIAVGDLGGLVFTPVGNNTGTFTFQVQDNGGTSNGGVDTDPIANNFTITQNVAPTVTAGGTLNYAENDGPTVIDSTIAITDTDSPDMAGAKVAITTGFAIQDVLDFTASGGITGLYDAPTGVLTLTGTASQAAYETVLESVTYRNTSDNPSTAQRTVSYTVNDGFVESAAGTATVNVTASNDAPLITPTGGSTAYIENAAAVTVDGTLTVTDPDSSIVSAQVRVSVGFQTGDSLNFVDQNGITGVYSAGVLALSGTASVADYQTALRSITFSSTNNDPGAPKTIEFKVNDALVDSNLATKTLAVSPVNDEPTLTVTPNGGGTVTFTESGLIGGSNPVDLFGPGNASAVETGQTLHNLVVTVSNVTDTTEFLRAGTGNTAVELQNHSETVNLSGGGTATATVVMSGTTATVTFDNVSGMTATQVNNLVDSLAYDNTDDTPTTGASAHTVTITSLSDDGATAAPNDNIASFNFQTNVTVVATNDAPTAGNFTFDAANSKPAIVNTSFVVDDPTDGAPNPAGVEKIVTGDLLAGASDADTSSSLWSISAVGGDPNAATTSLTNASGTIVFERDGDFTYTPAAGFLGNAVFSYQVNDNDPSGNATGTGTITIEVAPVTPPGGTTKIWYVDNTAAAGGDGTSDNPFDSLADVSGASGPDAAGDIIYVATGSGDYTGGITLLDNQILWGAGEALVVNGVTLAAAGTDPVIANSGGNGVTVEQGNTLKGFTVGNTTGFDIANTTAATVGSLTVSNVTLNGSGGLIRADSGGTLNVQLDSATTTNAGTKGIFLDNVDNSTFSVTGATTINDATQAGINIANSQNSTFTFTGKTTILNDAAGANGHGVDLQTNNTTDSTFNFNGGVDITVNGTDAFGFRAQSSGTVNILNPNSDNQITSNNGTAIFINPTAFQANLTTVTAGDGGTGDGIHLDGVSGTGVTIGSVSLNGMAGDGIEITNSSANITINGGSIGNTDDPAGNGVVVTGGAGNVTINASINDTTASNAVVSVANRAAGTVDFNGAITSTGTGISLTGNTGGTVNFDGGMNLSTGANAAFTVAGGSNAATLNVTGSNSLTTTTGQILSLDGVTIGVPGAAFGALQATGTTTGSAVLLNDVDGTNHTLSTSGITVAGVSGVGADGVRISGGSGATFSFGGTTTIANTADDGISISGGGGPVSFNTVALNGMTGDGVDISGNTAAVTLSAGSIGNTNDPAGAGVRIGAGTGDVSVGASITKLNDAGHVVDVSGHTGGILAFSGAISATGPITTADNGISLTSNSGAMMNFSGGMTLSTGANTAFNATGGATAVNVTNGANNHLTTTTGTALNIANTTIGASDVTFHDISSNGAANGIVLANTGTSGGLTVTGDSGSAVNSSGGTIQNTTGAGILLTSTRDVSLDQMNIQNTAGDGINGTTVTNFGFTNSTIAGAGDGANEFGIFITDLFGTGTINNSSITNSQTNNLRIVNSNSTAGTLNIANSTFTTTDAANGSDAVNVQTDNTGNLTVNLTDNNDLNNSQGDGIQASANQTSTLRVTVDGSNSNYNGNLGSAVNIAAANSAHIFALVQDFGNRATNTGGVSTGTNGVNGLNVINIQNFDTSIIDATVQNNVINGLGNNASGIRVIQEGNGTITAELDNNFIDGMGANGIVAQARAGTGQINLTVHDNDVHLASATALDAMSFESGSSGGGDSNTLRLDLFNNDADANTAGQSGYQLRVRAGTTFQLEDFTGSGTNTADVTAWINNAPKSNIGTTNILLTGAGASFGTIADVPMPSLPMLAAAGGVQSASNTPGETHLAQQQLDAIVAAAIGQWAAAGASSAQLGALAAITFTVADLAGNIIGDHTSGHIVIDTDAAGHGWFVDPTPFDNSEFTHAQNAEATDLLTDPSNAAAGHMDLLTVVTHEMGHALGLGDSIAPSDAHDLMYINLVDGERRVPDASDVGQANVPDALLAELALPESARAASGTPIIVGTAANDTIDAGHGGNILFGGAGADSFVFGPSIQLNAPTPAQITHVADYSAAQGDTFDFSALTSAFHNSSVNDALVVRAVEDASGKFAMLQVDHIDPMGLPSAPNWVNVAQLDGAHAGDSVNVLIDNNHSVHLAQIHVDLLV